MKMIPPTSTKELCGIILAGGNGSRLSPLTNSVNKHLLPIYDKPMIYYPLSTLMLSGIQDIAIICSPKDIKNYTDLLGDGRKLGIQIQYLIQEKPDGIPQAYQIAENFIQNRNIALILGDNLFLGQGLGRTLKGFHNILGASIFAFPVKNPADYGIVHMDNDTKEIHFLSEKPSDSKSNLAIPGLYITDSDAIEISKNLRKSKRGEFEIIDVLNSYLKLNKLNVSLFSRGIGWMDAGTVENLYAASELVRVLQERQGLKFGSPEEVSWQNGWIDDLQLVSLTSKMADNTYSEYLRNLPEIGKS
jgi:glucose-1-phosphate thymidylyltransferase